MSMEGFFEKNPGNANVWSTGSKEPEGIKMDKKNIYDVGSDIMEAVNEAVGSGDFSKLNASLRDVTGSAAGAAADALHDLQGHIQGGGSSAAGGSAAGGPAAGTGAGSPGGGRTYGHAGRASGNVTEEYMRRASGARHHTVFTSKVSPFLQRKVSLGSGTGKIIGGIACLVMAACSLMQTLAGGLVAGILSGLGGGGFGALVLFPLIVTLGLAVLGGVLIKSGQERKKLVREYYAYGKVAGTAEYLEISRLARAVGESREKVLANLEKMIEEDMLPAAWFDRQKTTLMLSEQLYNEYLQLERERQARQVEEEKEKMAERARRQDGLYGGAAAGSGGPDAFEGADQDLKPLPEDAKLPAEARKIVEEGLLYMGRIRDFNRAIADEDISEELAQLEITMKRIIEQIRKDPSSAPNLRRLMVYYLPTTMKLLQAYRELDDQPVKGENILSTKREIREALGTINEAFERLLDSLFQDMAWDISSDISVMKTMMAQDGLTGDRLREAGRGKAREGFSAAGTAGSAVQEAGAVPEAAAAGTAAAGTAEGAAQQAFTDGFTEGLAEPAGGLQFGTAAAAGTFAQDAAAPEAEKAKAPEEEGIRLKFGE